MAMSDYFIVGLALNGALRLPAAQYSNDNLIPTLSALYQKSGSPTLIANCNSNTTKVPINLNNYDDVTTEVIPALDVTQGRFTWNDSSVINVYINSKSPDYIAYKCTYNQYYNVWTANQVDHDGNIIIGKLTNYHYRSDNIGTFGLLLSGYQPDSSSDLNINNDSAVANIFYDAVCSLPGSGSKSRCARCGKLKKH